MTKEELKTILENHNHWLEEDCEGWEGMKADLRNADLRNADLRNANLRNANLRYADLSNFDLRNADLSNADLRNADLSNADLRNANLRYADLSNADLRNADLRNANLRYADLSNANLRYADLSNANLRNANLRYADLSNADLSNADLSNADLLEARNLYVPYSCPDFGIFIGWKKCRTIVRNIAVETIVQLEIPEDAKRLSATGRKCRCDKAKVIRITNIDGTEEYETAYSTYNTSFTYKVGETVSVDNFDENRWVECSTGIHFFINRQEAVNY